MYSVTRLLDVVEADRVRIRQELQQVARQCDAVRQLVAPTLTGSRNGGDLLVHLRFDSAEAWSAAADRFDAALRDPAITRVNGADYPGSPQIIGGRSPGRVYRTLLLRVAPGTDGPTADRFEADLRLLPGYVDTISAWQLSRAERTVGDTQWTHVFEQEFTDADGIMGAYLMHPIHWAVVDQWFDPECPKVIVRERVCHSFCSDEARVLR
ncbi:stress responsive protein [Mycolicibacterium duvalii]|uniref:Stress responsive protein n=1 Tax=Mycolicibacterium duvalii TaxID=39688 RepID=A0A7I7K358_9MYCO|nr:Dabb family protein [Mycolicibacterium duvalii]MCV7366578.1 Dabb family protein [Mycolicibacterium duvalii]PEG41630.1 stress responsive protein [Mycolicibacterium duvalii]BBX17812.1 stress responsive protein [Mycolicibacterium duvalii]